MSLYAGNGLVCPVTAPDAFTVFHFKAAPVLNGEPANDTLLSVVSLAKAPDVDFGYTYVNTPTFPLEFPGNKYAETFPVIDGGTPDESRNRQFVPAALPITNDPKMLAVAALVSMTALAFDSVSVVAVDALQTYTPLFAVFLNPVTITVLPLYRLDAPLVMAPVYTA